jgi:hypothetical protein
MVEAEPFPMPTLISLSAPGGGKGDALITAAGNQHLSLSGDRPETGKGKGPEERLSPYAYTCWIGYFAKICSARFSAWSAACSGAIPLLTISAQATWKTCSLSTSAIAGLYAS